MAKEPVCVNDVFQLIDTVIRKIIKEQELALDAIDIADSGPVIERYSERAFDEIEAILKAHPLSERAISMMLLWFGGMLAQVESLLKDINNISDEREDLAAGKAYLDKVMRSTNAAFAAKVKHANSAAGKAKNSIRQLWLDWQRNPNRYRSASAFARDMLDKYPDEIRNQQTVARWCREWSAAQSAPIGLPAAKS